MTAELAMREAEIAAQRKEFLPDFMARGTYKQMLEGEEVAQEAFSSTSHHQNW